ncbi:MAG: hypothetical protein HY727_20835 [Candidatus Rokubacteria bacterium]|nr:hypothetical protein [Candidatus Rokubacteria bacterium]
MRRLRGFLALGLTGLVLLATAVPVGPASAAEEKVPKRPPAGPLVTIHAPNPAQLEVSLEEIELDWSADPASRGRVPAASAVEVASARLTASADLRAVFSLTGMRDLGDLRTMARALEAVNPGARGHLVVYEPGQDRTPGARQVLTREVAFLLEDGYGPAAVLAGLARGPAREVRSVRGGYVVEAVDPVAALDLADALRQRPGVTSAYPLLKRLRFPR